MTWASRALGAAAIVWLAWLLALPPRPEAGIVFAVTLPLLIAGSWIAARRRHTVWAAFVRHTVDWHALAVLIGAALAVQFQDAHGVTTDGVIYFTQLRSVVFDRDLHVAAEFAYLDQPPRPYHVVPIGPTLVWLPLYLSVAAIDAIGRTLGAWPAPAEPAALGLTLPYVRAALVSSFAIGVVGVVVLHRRLREEFGAGVALVASVLLVGATPLAWYLLYEPAMTHAASFGFVALFVIAAERWTSVAMGRPRAVRLGVLLGLAFVTRPQEALFALFPAGLLMAAAAPWRDRLLAAARLAGWAFLGALPFLLLQAIHSSILFSREAFAVTGEGGYLDLWHSRWMDTLWSSWHGFFSWTPVAYVAAIGLVFYAARHRAWAITGVLLVFLMAWINGAAQDWAAGWSFGGRRFISTLVVLAPGLALVIQALTRTPMAAIALVAAAAVGWHQLLEAQYRTGVRRAGEPVPFAQLVREQASMATRPPFIYPFAFPANAWFAWRTGLPMEAYDLLGPQPLRPAIDLSMGAPASALVMRGWGAHVSDAFGELRWMDAEEAEIVLPLDPVADDGVTFTAAARTRQVEGAAPVTVTVVVNGAVAGVFTPATDQVKTTTFEAKSGRWRRGFNRVVFRKAAGTPPVALYRLTLR